MKPFIFAAALLTFTSCSTPENVPLNIPDITEPVTSAQVSEVLPQTLAAVSAQKGTGFLMRVTMPDGTGTQINIHTEKTTVCDALLEDGLSDGTSSKSGFYITSVNGVTADYDKDGAYWAFYIDGEYAATDVSKTKIDSNKVYSFVYTIS